MKRTSSYTVILLLFCLLLGRDASAADAQDRRYAIVYLDPHYGGKENGPTVDQKSKGKDVTLALALAIQRELKNQKVETFLSRDEDLFIPSGDRWFYAKKKGAQIYLSLRLRSQDRECVQLYYAKRQLLRRTANDADGLQDAASDPRVEAVAQESLRLSETLAKGLKNAPALCGAIQSKKDVVFETADFPAVILEFGAARRANQQSFVVDPAKVGTLAASIAQSIKEFIETEPRQ